MLKDEEPIVSRDGTTSEFCVLLWRDIARIFFWFLL